MGEDTSRDGAGASTTASYFHEAGPRSGYGKDSSWARHQEASQPEGRGKTKSKQGGGSGPGWSKGGARVGARLGEIQTGPSAMGSYGRALRGQQGSSARGEGSSSMARVLSQQREREELGRNARVDEARGHGWSRGRLDRE
jgi:hypothetical protein|uniref:Uncharacterized protein n=1 Tax=Zea mays TaxID=4577 RepID=A0A804Q9S4_MAIZE